MDNNQKNAKTYNSRYSLMVTHLTTNPPVRCLSMAERTGSRGLNVLWSYVEVLVNVMVYVHGGKRSLTAGDVGAIAAIVAEGI
jgi:hypothetical protein